MTNGIFWRQKVLIFQSSPTAHFSLRGPETLRLLSVTSPLCCGCLRVLDEMNCAAREVLTLCVLGSGFSPTLSWLISSHSLFLAASGVKCVCVSLFVWVRGWFCGRLSCATHRHWSQISPSCLSGSLLQSLLCVYFVPKAPPS